MPARKPFNPSLALIMTNLANDRVSIKSSNSVLGQSSSLLYITLILQLYLVYEINTLPRNPSNNFTIKVFYFVELVKNAMKS